MTWDKKQERLVQARRDAYLARDALACLSFRFESLDRMGYDGYKGMWARVEEARKAIRDIHEALIDICNAEGGGEE